MELRYYFTYAAVFIFLQLFLYSFTRTLGWFFNLSITKRKALTLISYLVVNAIFLLQLARVISAFRSVAPSYCLLFLPVFLPHFATT